MRIFLKILGALFALIAIAFTACGILDYFCNTGRGTYIEIDGDEE